MAQYDTKFATRSRGAQLVETGTGDTPSWTGYLTDKEFGAYQKAQSHVDQTRKWGAINAGLAVVWGTLLVASGGTIGLPSLAISGVLAIVMAASHIKNKGKVSDFQATALTRAASQGHRSSQRPAAYSKS